MSRRLGRRDGHPLKDYVAVLFEHLPQRGWGPRVVTPQAQYARDESGARHPPGGLPPIFPTPVSLQKRERRLRIETMPAVSATPKLQAEAALSTEYLRPHFTRPAGKVGSPPLRPARVFYGLQSLRCLLPAVATVAPRQRAGLPRDDDHGRNVFRLPRAPATPPMQSLDTTRRPTAPAGAAASIESAYLPVQLPNLPNLPNLPTCPKALDWHARKRRISASAKRAESRTSRPPRSEVR